MTQHTQGRQPAAFAIGDKTQMPNEDNTIKIHAKLYQISTGNSGYEGKPLAQAAAAGGPDITAYAKVLDTYLEGGTGKNVTAQLSQAFQEKADAKRPLSMSDILILSSESIGTNAYYLDTGNVWKHIDLDLRHERRGSCQNMT